MNDLCGFEPTLYTSAPQQTEGWIVFHQSPEKVFARISDHATLGDWVPFVQKVTVTHPRQLAPGESTIGSSRAITFTGGLAVIEKVVYWNPPYCYAYTSEGKHFPFKDYVGLFRVEPADAESGKFIFREYFNQMGPLGQAILPHGVVALFSLALGNLSRLIDGTEYDMTVVSLA